MKVVEGLIRLPMFPWPDLPDLHLAIGQTAAESAGMADWMSTALNIGVGGATAVIGGFAGAYLSEWFAASRRAVDEKNRHKSSAFALQLQLMGIYTDLMQYREHLGQSRVAFRAHLPGPRFRAQYHQAFSGNQAEVHFRIEDLQALAAYGSGDLLNVIADLDRRFNSIAAALNQYRSAWLALGDQLEGDLQGSVIVLSLTQQDMKRLGPKFASLSKILVDLEPMVEETIHDTYRALVGLFHARVKSFGQTGTFEAINPSGVFEQI